MPKGLPQNLGTWMAQVERKLDNLSSGNRLDHASLDGTTLYLKGDGELGRIGRQPDGSNGVHIAKVKPPPQLTAPILTVGEMAGTCLVEWDGGTFDGRRMPLIHGHTEVWAELVGDEWEPTVAPGDSAKRVGTIRDRTGGEVVVALPQAGTWAVWLRAMGADRETAGPWSPVSQVEISPLVDTDAIEAELDEARDRLAQAEQDLAAGMADRVAEIEYLREVRIPALQDALTTGLDDVYRDAQAYAEAQADDAVNRAAADAQSEYDRLEELAGRAMLSAGDNLVFDPSLESTHWIDEFSSRGNRTYTHINDPDLVLRDDHSIAISGGNQVWQPLYEGAFSPGQRVQFSIWLRAMPGDPPVGTSFQFSVRSDRGDGMTTREYVLKSEFSETSWERLSLIYEVHEDDNLVSFPLLPRHSSGVLLIDFAEVRDVSLAYEALEAARRAREAAEAAHQAAGEAADQAALAYDAASSKSSVHWSLSAPSGTADSTDDVWWQYELRNGRRVVTGQWFWDNGVWRETEIAEEWLPLVNIGTGTYGDLSGDRLEANTVKAGALAVMPDTEDYAPDPGENPDLWELTGGRIVANTTNAANPSNVAFRFSQDTTRIRGPIRPVTPGKQIRFNGRYTWWSSSNTGATVEVVMEWFSSPTANRSGTSLFATVESGSIGHWVEGTVTVPEDAIYGRLYFYQPDTTGGDAGFWGTIACEPMVGGVLIENGAVNSEKVNTLEFFAAQAVIEAIWTDIVRSRLIQSEGIITEDMIATGAITTPKLTVTEEMVGEVARLLRIEAGSLASNDIEAMRIVSSLIEATTYLIHDANGDVSVRLDGVANYIAGRLHAGMTESEGVVLDWGEKVRYSGLTEEGDPAPDRTITTPYLNFHTDDTSYLTGREPSIHLDRDDPSGRSGMMVINPGYPVGTDTFRGKLNVVGDVQANRTEAREWSIARNGFNIPNSNPGLNTTISQESSTGNTYLLGRHHGASQSRARDSFWVSDQYELAAGGRRRRLFTWGTPPPTGFRRPVLSVHLTPAAASRNAYVVANSSSASSTGYDINEHNISSERATYYIHQLAIWGDA